MPPLGNHHPRRVPDPGSGLQGTQTPPGDGRPSLPPQQALEPPESCPGPGAPNLGLFPPILVSQEMESRARPLPESP